MTLFKAGKSRPEIFAMLRGENYSRQFIDAVIKRCGKRGHLKDAQRSGAPRSVRTPSIKKAIAMRFKRSPARSARKLSAQMGISRRTLGRVISEDLGFFPYRKRKIPLAPATAFATRVQRSKALLTRHDLQDVTNVLFTDEKIFTIQVKHNPQNNRVYGPSFEEIPEHERFIRNKLHPQQVMVWAGVSAVGKTDLFFVEQGVKVNAQNYKKEILVKLVEPLNQTMFKGEPWVFMQDGAPAHKAKTTQSWLSSHVPGFIASHEWPPYSPDLNPMDFYVWGRLEERVNNKEHRSLEELKKFLLREWAQLDQQEVCRACLSWRDRLTRCVRLKDRNVEQY